MAKHGLEGVLCCLVIYANLHRLPCICIKMVPTGIFSTFLLTVGITVEKGSFEHGKTWFKWFRRVFCHFSCDQNIAKHGLEGVSAVR